MFFELNEKNATGEERPGQGGNEQDERRRGNRSRDVNRPPINFQPE